MKAIVVREFGEPEVMKLEEAATPRAIGTQVLVRVHAVGVNPVETYIRSGNYASVPSLPYTPGKDAAGVVESVGESVTRWKSGDRVYTAQSITGTYAEFTLCEEIDLGRLPENVSFEKGAGIWTPYATSYRALFQKAKVKARETVLIHGASGGVGIAAVQWLTGGQASLLAGGETGRVTVIGTASSDEGKKLVAEQGADVVMDHLSVQPAVAGGSMRAYSAAGQRIIDSIQPPATAGGTDLRVDVIIEMLANVNLQKDFEVLAMFGRICVVGNRGSLDFNPRAIMGKDATVTGMALYNAPRAAFEEIHAAIYEGLSKGYLNPVISRTFPIEDAAAAHNAVINDKSAGKIVLIT